MSSSNLAVKVFRVVLLLFRSNFTRTDSIFSRIAYTNKKKERKKTNIKNINTFLKYYEETNMNNRHDAQVTTYLTCYSEANPVFGWTDSKPDPMLPQLVVFHLFQTFDVALVLGLFGSQTFLQRFALCGQLATLLHQDALRREKVCVKDRSNKTMLFTTQLTYTHWKEMIKL